jgi:hypothetical protein
MNKFFIWVSENRRLIGLVIGVLSLFTAGLDYAAGDSVNAVMFLIIGIAIATDAWDTK